MQVLQTAGPFKKDDKLKKQTDVSLEERLYDKYAPLVFSIITKIIPDDKKAEDTLVEVFLYLHKHLSDYNPAYNTFSVWLLNNARNIAVNNLCSMQEDYPCDINFKTLSLAEKTVFALFYFRLFSVCQIVEVLHLPVPVIERLLRSAEMKAK